MAILSNNTRSSRSATSIDDIGRMHRIDNIVEVYLDEVDEGKSLSLRKSLYQLSYSKVEELYNELMKQ